MNEFILEVNGNNYLNWTSISIQRSVDSFSGSFNFSSTDTESSDYPIKVSDSVRVIVDNVPLITGFVDEVEDGFDLSSHTISVRGRDNVRNLIDTDIPNAWKENVTEIPDFLTLCRLIIRNTNNNDIQLVNVAGTIPPFREEELEESETGQKAMDFLSSFARKRSLYLNTDGRGALRIYRPQNISAFDSLVLLRDRDDPRNNIKRRSVRFSHAERFRNVVVRSQEDSAEGIFDFSGSDAVGNAVDSEISDGRNLEIISEELMTDSECAQRAREEVNIRRARTTSYTCTVAGASQSNGVLWDYGLVVTLVDEIARIFGKFFIRSVTITRSLSEGTNTVLELAPADAYKVIATLTQQDLRLTDLGEKYR